MGGGGGGGGKRGGGVFSVIFLTVSHLVKNQLLEFQLRLLCGGEGGRKRDKGREGDVLQLCDCLW